MVGDNDGASYLMDWNIIKQSVNLRNISEIKMKTARRKISLDIRIVVLTRCKMWIS